MIFMYSNAVDKSMDTFITKRAAFILINQFTKRTYFANLANYF